MALRMKHPDICLSTVVNKAECHLPPACLGGGRVAQPHPLASLPFVSQQR